MAFRIDITLLAKEDLVSTYLWLKAHQSAEVADSWYNVVATAIESLSEFPARCALAPEGRAHRVELRKKLFGNRRSVYRILFQIVDDASGSVVKIVRIRHSAQQHLRFDELNLS